MLRKSTILTLLILSLFVCGLQMAGPVTAVKVIDQGTYIYHNNETDKTYKSTWKAYQYNKNYIYVKLKFYENGKIIQTETSTIKKISSKKIKLVSNGQTTYITSGSKTYTYYKIISYIKYMTIKEFYFKSLKPEFKYSG